MGKCLSKKSQELKGGPGAQEKEIYRDRETMFNPINENDSPLEKDYQIQKTLGIGAFGRVVEALHLPSQESRAIKIIDTRHMHRDDKLKIFQEIKILSKLDHPNIIKIYEYFNSNRNIYIVTELLTDGELFEKIIQCKKFSEADAAKTMKEVLSAIQYCHEKQIVHRDLKPENILVEGQTIKIIDFGTSRKFEANKMMSNSHGTPYYIAPEVLLNRYNEKCDIWSCGVILYILLCGLPPFNGRTDTEIMENVKLAQFKFGKDFNHVSKLAKDLISKMLTVDFQNRPSAKQCLQHAWFSAKIEEIPHEINLQIIDNLKTFNYKSKLQEAIYKFFVNQIATKEEKKEMMETFKALDKNHDGILTKEELREGLRGNESLMNEADLEKLFSKLDDNKSGGIDYSEFVAASLNRKVAFSDEKITACFQLFDRDRSGKISILEFKNKFQKSGGINDQHWLEIMKEADRNGDGEIDFTEFKELLKKMI